jgi:hypothetical protein
LQIDGAQWAAAFAFHAFFSLFPMMVLLVTIASYFVDGDRAGKEARLEEAGFTSSSGGVRALSVTRSRSCAARGDEKPLQAESSSPGRFRVRGESQLPRG